MLMPFTGACPLSNGVERAAGLPSLASAANPLLIPSSRIEKVKFEHIQVQRFEFRLPSSIVCKNLPGQTLAWPWAALIALERVLVVPALAGRSEKTGN